MKFDSSYWREFMLQPGLENPPEHALEHLEQCPDCKLAVDQIFHEKLEKSRHEPVFPSVDSSRIEIEPSRELIERLKLKCQEEPALFESYPATLEKIGRYIVLHELGHGGMNKVYCCQDEILDRQVAVKLFPHVTNNENRRERMRREARLQAAFSHPNIVRLLEVNTEFETPFIVMEVMRGGSLKELKQSGPVPPQRAAAYMETIARAVHFAHENGVLHRDLKPSNILIENPVIGDDPFPSELTLKIADFGLARAIGTDSELTSSNMLVGTPAYMSPEQTEGDSTRLTPASDIYALGAILYDLLVGRAPIIADDLRLTLAMIRETSPISPRLLQPNVNKDLETICLKCLEKEPGRRYVSALALAEDLSRFQQARPIHARPVSELSKAWRWCQRNRALAGALFVAFISLASLVGGTIQFMATRERLKNESLEVRMLARENSIQAIQVAKKIQEEEGRVEIDYFNSIRTSLEWFEDLNRSSAAGLTLDQAADRLRSFKGRSVEDLKRLFNRIENDFSKPEANIQICALLTTLLDEAGNRSEANAWLDRMVNLVFNYPETQKMDHETMKMIYKVSINVAQKARALTPPDDNSLAKVREIYRNFPLDRLASSKSDELVTLRKKLGEIVDKK